MRGLASKDKILEFMRLFGRAAGKIATEVYFTGGSTAVLMGWRETTIDIDIKFDPESDEIYRSIPKIKEDMQINVELAAPPDFIPEVPGWRNRCRFIETVGKVSFFHYDPYSQALAKIERAHVQDRLDVRSMIEGGLIDLSKLADMFEKIRPNLNKYPAIDVENFVSNLEEVLRDEDVNEKNR